MESGRVIVIYRVNGKLPENGKDMRWKLKMGGVHMNMEIITAPNNVSF